jgi:hypothetical protein
MERENYDTMTPHEMLAKLKHHEILDDEAIEASAGKKSIALTASQASGSSHCNKGSCKHESNDSDEDLDDEQALLVRNYKYLRIKKDKMRRNGGKPYKKRFCYECGDIDHFAADCPNKEKKSRYNKKGDKKHKNKKKGEAHLGQEWQSDDDSEDDNDNGNEKKSVAAIAIHETSSSTKSFTNDASSTSLFTNTSSSSRLFANLSDDNLDTPTCLMAKGDKVSSDSPTPYSNKCESDDEDDEQYATNLIKRFGKDATTKILNLMYTIDKRESCIESQGELLLEEREKNQGLEACLSKEKEKVEKLRVELSLAKDSYERLSKEHSSLNDSLASLKSDYSLVQDSLTSLKDKHHELELNYDTLLKSTSTLSKNSKASTSEGCEKCYNVDINACALTLLS